MCGILGQIGKNKKALQELDLSSLLGHRGPDALGIVNQSVGGKCLLLAHTRLSILDVSDSGAQPMRSQSGRWLIAYNGEIFNHLEIRDQLCANFRGGSDTETLAEALDFWGLNRTLRELNGMFAFAAIDTVEAKLFLVRDPFGIKPLYFSSVLGELTFSSEMRGVRSLSENCREIDNEGLDLFLGLRYVPSPKTMWKDISKLPPGHVLEYDIDSGGVSVECFVKPVRAKFAGSMAEAIEQYHSLLKHVVRKQMLSDVPVGMFLSGGVDSAIIAAMAVEYGVDIPTYTVGFGHQHKECEIESALHTAQVLGLKNHNILMSSSGLWEAMQMSFEAIEEPLGTTSVLPMWFLAARAKQDVKVVLTGQGCDEPWGGYRRYQGELIGEQMPGLLPWASMAKMANRVSGMPEYIERAFRSWSKEGINERFAENYALFTGQERQALTGREGSDSMLKPIDFWLRWCSSSHTSAVEKMMSIDTRMNLADDLLLYSDKITMAHSLEARVPLLDIDVVNFVESLPRDFRVRFNSTKVVHKAMAEKYLPECITSRPKLGFQVPVAKWLTTDWKSLVEGSLLEPGSAVSKLVAIDAVRNEWADHISGKRDRSRQLFALLGLAVWAEKNLEL